MKKPTKPELVVDAPRGLENQPQRRLVLPVKKTQTDLKLKPNTLTPDDVLTDAFNVISIDIARYKDKVTRKGEMLTLAEAKAVQGHIKAMIDLKREIREQDRADDLSKLSEQELFALAKKALSAVPEIPEAEVVSSPDDIDD